MSCVDEFAYAAIAIKDGVEHGGEFVNKGVAAHVAVDAVHNLGRRVVVDRDGAEGRADGGHHECGWDALSDHVCDGDGDGVVGQFDEVEEVAADVQRRIVDASEFDEGVFRRFVGDHASLDVTGVGDLATVTLCDTLFFEEPGFDDAGCGVGARGAEHGVVVLCESVLAIVVDADDADGCSAIGHRSAESADDAFGACLIGVANAWVGGGIGDVHDVAFEGGNVNGVVVDVHRSLVDVGIRQVERGGDDEFAGVLFEQTDAAGFGVEQLGDVFGGLVEDDVEVCGAGEEVGHVHDAGERFEWIERWLGRRDLWPVGIHRGDDTVWIVGGNGSADSQWWRWRRAVNRRSGSRRRGRCG